MKIRLIVSLMLLVCAVSVHAQEEKMSAAQITAFKAAVNTTAKNTKTLTAAFTQYKHMDFLAKDIVTSGTMTFKAPSMLLWKYTSPYQYSIAFKNGKILIDDAGRKSTVNAKSSKMFDKLSKMIVGSVNGNMFDENEFSIAFYSTDAYHITKLLPKDASMKKYIRQMELYFDKKTNTVTEVKMTEQGGDYTKIVFKNKTINAAVPDSVFSL